MKEIKYKDIQKGDTIRQTYMDTGNVFTERQGIAHKEDRGVWETESGGLIAAEGWPGRPIYLIDRPKPPLPTKPLPQIIATKVRGNEGRWEMYVDNVGIWGTVNADPIRGQLYLSACDIEEWKLIE